jgi:hypothetical protein
VTEKEQLHRMVEQLGTDQATALLAELHDRYPAPDPAATGEVTLTLTPIELRLVRAALRSYLEIFGHDEKDVGATIRTTLAKLAVTQDV